MKESVVLFLLEMSLLLFICDIWGIFAGELPVHRDPGLGLKCSKMIQSFRYRIIKIEFHSLISGGSLLIILKSSVSPITLQ